MRKLETNNKDAKLDPQEEKYDGELGVNDIDSKLNPHGELNGKEKKRRRARLGTLPPSLPLKQEWQ